MDNIIEEADFISIAQDLQADKKYLLVAERLKNEGKYRRILDRQSGELYLERHYYLNLRPFARLVIHHFRRSDVDGLHNHPWPFQVYILSGGYWEDTEEGKFWRATGHHKLVELDYFHRVILDPEKAMEDTWTLFLMGPKQQEWGFLNESKEWVQHNEYLGEVKEDE